MGLPYSFEFIASLKENSGCLVLLPVERPGATVEIRKPKEQKKQKILDLMREVLRKLARLNNSSSLIQILVLGGCWSLFKLTENHDRDPGRKEYGKAGTLELKAR